ncbi:MAG: class I SAM-dependent methyltransferase, partial [Candidatus Asgardarchaeia archaeon]
YFNIPPTIFNITTMLSGHIVINDEQLFNESYPVILQSGADIIADAEYLPFKDGQFDLLTTFDVLEHIPEEEINMVFQEFKRVANKFFYQICLGRGKRHITLKSPTWWLLKIIENQGDIGQITYYDGANNIVPKNKARWITVYGFFNKN